MVHSFPTRRSSDLSLRSAKRHCSTDSASRWQAPRPWRSEEHTSELQSHHPISYAVFCLKKKIISIEAMVPPLRRISVIAVSGSSPSPCSIAAISELYDIFFFLMIRRPPRSTLDGNSFPTRRSSDLEDWQKGGVMRFPASITDGTSNTIF